MMLFQRRRSSADMAQSSQIPARTPSKAGLRGAPLLLDPGTRSSSKREPRRARAAAPRACTHHGFDGDLVPLGEFCHGACVGELADCQEREADGASILGPRRRTGGRTATERGGGKREAISPENSAGPGGASELVTR